MASKLKESQKLMIVGGVGAGLSVLALGGVYWASGLVDVEKEAITQKRTQIAEAQKKIAKIPDLEQRVIILRENVDAYVRILPETPEVNVFVRKINTFAQQSGVMLEKLDKSQVTKKGKFSRYAYKINFSATIWQFMKFMNLFESDERFLSVANFAVSTGAKGDSIEEIEGGAEHKVTMTVETYTYNGQKGDEAGVKIAAYESKRERLSDLIWQQRNVIRLDKYEYKDARGRRDILVDPRHSSTSTPDGPSLPEQEKRVDTFSARVTELLALYEQTKDPALTFLEKYQLEKRLVDEITEVTKGIQEVRNKELITWQPLKQRWANEVVQPFEALRAEALQPGTDSQPSGLSEAQLRAELAQMKQEFNNDALNKARERYEAIESQIQAKEGTTEFELALELATLYRKAGIALEFSQIRIEVGGVVVNGQGRSGLLINGEVFEEGDYLSESLLLKRVGREEAEFIYRGYTVIKSW